jgi:hypothetical protein
VSNTGPTTTGTAAAPNVASVFGVPPLPPSLGPLPVGQARVSIDLPGLGLVTGVPDEIRALARGLRGRRDAPIELVENCRQTIATAALPYGAIQVDGAAAGPVRTVRGGYSLPVTFNVVYRRRGGLEARHATVNCLMNTAGQVVATR